MEKNEEKIDVLGTVVQLMEHKKIILENIDRLKKNQGYVVDGPNKGCPRNTCTKMELHYGAHVHIYSTHDNELNVLLAKTALDYYNQKLESTEFLLNLAATTLTRELSAKLNSPVNIKGE